MTTKNLNPIPVLPVRTATRYASGAAHTYPVEPVQPRDFGIQLEAWLHQHPLYRQAVLSETGAGISVQVADPTAPNGYREFILEIHEATAA